MLLLLHFTIWIVHVCVKALKKKICPAIFAETPGGDKSYIVDVTNQEVVYFRALKMETIVLK